MPSFTVSIGSGGETHWSAIVEAKDRRDARAKAMELLENGGGHRPRVTIGAGKPRAKGPMKVTVEPSSIPGSWGNFLRKTPPPR